MVGPPFGGIGAPFLHALFIHEQRHLQHLNRKLNSGTLIEKSGSQANLRNYFCIADPDPASHFTRFRQKTE